MRPRPPSITILSVSVLLGATFPNMLCALGNARFSILTSVAPYSRLTAWCPVRPMYVLVPEMAFVFTGGVILVLLILDMAALNALVMFRGSLVG